MRRELLGQRSHSVPAGPTGSPSLPCELVKDVPGNTGRACGCGGRVAAHAAKPPSQDHPESTGPTCPPPGVPIRAILRTVTCSQPSFPQCSGAASAGHSRTGHSRPSEAPLPAPCQVLGTGTNPDRKLPSCGGADGRPASNEIVLELCKGQEGTPWVRPWRAPQVAEAGEKRGPVAKAERKRRRSGVCGSRGGDTGIWI